VVHNCRIAERNRLKLCHGQRLSHRLYQLLGFPVCDRHHYSFTHPDAERQLEFIGFPDIKHYGGAFTATNHRFVAPFLARGRWECRRGRDAARGQSE
jgi:hypothetical protein